MQQHVHGYAWNGRGSDLATEEGRRPEHPSFDPNDPQQIQRHGGRPFVFFRQDPRPPLMVHHWLLKPPGLIRGTWVAAKEAADWLAEEWRRGGADTGVPLGVMRQAAEDQVEQGNDVVWSAWLPSGSIVYRAAVPCPPSGAHGPVLSCPGTGR